MVSNNNQKAANIIFPARIFISHSTKEDVPAEYLRAIHQALEADPRFVPKLDNIGLRGGDDWRECLYKWMDHSHGSVVLLSREALQSSFIPIELSVLSFRAVREQNFPLIPILLPDISFEDVDQGVIGDIQLKRLQFISGLRPAEAAHEVIKQLVAQLEPERLQPRNRRELLFDQLRDCLMDAKLKPSDLECLALSVQDWPLINWTSRRDPYFLFAETLVSAGFERACGMLCRIREGRPAVTDALSRLLDLLAPLWVDEKEARRVGEVALNENPQLRTIYMQASDGWTVEAYIYRARGCGLGEPIQPLLVGPPETENPEKDVARYLLQHLTPPNPAWRRLPQPPLSAVLRGYEEQESKRCIFLIFNTSQWPATRNLINKLRSEIETPAYCFFSPEIKKGDQDECILVVGPESDQEISIFVQYFNTLRTVGV